METMKLIMSNPGERQLLEYRHSMSPAAQY